MQGKGAHEESVPKLPAIESFAAGSFAVEAHVVATPEVETLEDETLADETLLGGGIPADETPRVDPLTI